MNAITKAALTLLIAPAVLIAGTQWFACELTDVASLDRLDPHGEPVPAPPIADLLVMPQGPLTVDAGTEFFIEVKAVDSSGQPIPSTEGAIRVEADGTHVEIVRLCGGNDLNEPECAGLSPAYHQYDDDGVMWAFFRAINPTTQDPSPITFAYPWDPNVTNAFTHEVTVEVTVEEPAAADSDGDGVSDADDQCPNTPSNTSVDADGCPLSPPQQTNLSPTTTTTVVRTSTGDADSHPGFLVAGDHQVDGSHTIQAFVQYDISGLSGTIESAEILVTRNPMFDEGNPFSSLGGLYVERANGIVLNEGSLQSDAILVSSALFTSETVDVTSLVQAAVDAGQTTLTLRFRFEKPESDPTNGVNDNIDLTVGGVDVEYRP